MQCPKCGHDNRPDASACSSCYYDLSSTMAPVIPPPVNDATKVQSPAPVAQPVGAQPAAAGVAPTYQANPAPGAPGGYPGPQSMQNTSGTGNTAVVPAELQGWNWGAFFLNWIWSIGNNTWIGLLAILPVLSIIMPFVLGAKGNEWAWKAKKWQDANQFKNTQRVWAIVGAVFFVLNIFFTIILLAILFPVFARAREAARAQAGM